jgi:hypothetical protein
MGDGYLVEECQGATCITVELKFQSANLGFWIYNSKLGKRLAWYFVRREIAKHKATGKSFLDEVQEWPK